MAADKDTHGFDAHTGHIVTLECTHKHTHTQLASPHPTLVRCTYSQVDARKHPADAKTT